MARYGVQSTEDVLKRLCRSYIVGFMLIVYFSTSSCSAVLPTLLRSFPITLASCTLGI